MPVQVFKLREIMLFVDRCLVVLVVFCGSYYVGDSYEKDHTQIGKTTLKRRFHVCCAVLCDAWRVTLLAGTSRDSPDSLLLATRIAAQRVWKRRLTHEEWTGLSLVEAVRAT